MKLQFIIVMEQIHKIKDKILSKSDGDGLIQVIKNLAFNHNLGYRQISATLPQVKLVSQIW